MRRRLTTFVSILATFLVAPVVPRAEFFQASNAQTVSTRVYAIPRPFDISLPVAPSRQYGEQDLGDFSDAELTAAAREAVAGGAFADAVQFQYWSTIVGSGSLYDLACYYSLDKNMDAAAYWLQRAAREEGVDEAWAAKDADLALLHQDARWPVLHDYLGTARHAWNGVSETLWVTPTGYDGHRALPLVMGLHGFGSQAGDFAGARYQHTADAAQVGIVGVSATNSRGPDSFIWADDLASDRARIERALSTVHADVSAGETLLFGFSQGARVAAEIAIREPEKYAGALLMSIGTSVQSKLSLADKVSAISEQRYIITYGEAEAEATIERAHRAAQELIDLGADVTLLAYPEMGHTFAHDYMEKMPEWIAYLLKRRAALE